MKIVTDTRYGKPIGVRGCYAGFPMTSNIRIYFLSNDEIYLELDMILIFTEDKSEYKLSFSWGSAPHCKDSDYNYTRSEFQEILQKDTWTKDSYEQNSLLNIGIEECYSRLRLENIYITITDENRAIIMDFLNQFKELLHKFLSEAEKLYQYEMTRNI